jgi:hypothetical protein
MFPNFIASDDGDERRSFGYLLLESRCAADSGRFDLHQIFNIQGVLLADRVIARPLSLRKGNLLGTSTPQAICFCFCHCKR